MQQGVLGNQCGNNTMVWTFCTITSYFYQWSQANQLHGNFKVYSQLPQVNLFVNCDEAIDRNCSNAVQIYNARFKIRFTMFLLHEVNFTHRKFVNIEYFLITLNSSDFVQKKINRWRDS